jgi:hypothetical protein
MEKCNKSSYMIIKTRLFTSIGSVPVISIQSSIEHTGWFKYDRD